MINLKRYLNLYLFDGAGAGGAAGAAASGTGAAGASSPGAGAVGEGTNSGANAAGSAGTADNGQAAADNNTAGAENVTSNTLEDRRAEFEKLIKGEYKDLFSERTQQIIDSRFKANKTAEKANNAMKSENERLKSMLTPLMDKYNVKDIDALDKALSSDKEMFEALAAEKGMSVERYMEMQKIQRELDTARQTVRQAEAEKTLMNWMQQGEKLKAVYPGFDLRTEMGNEDFSKLLKAGIDIKTAFEVVHRDELTTNALAYARKQTAAEVANNIKSRQGRPAENGTNNAAPAVTKIDVTKMTRAEREALERRALRGEKITLREPLK